MSITARSKEKLTSPVRACPDMPVQPTPNSGYYPRTTRQLPPGYVVNIPSKARFPYSLTDAEFVSLFRVEELPECSEGLWLLKQWIESDPQIVGLLQGMERVQWDSLDVDQNPIFRRYVLHTRTCETCQRRQGMPA